MPGDRLPRDRRARAPGPAARDAGRQRAEHGALARRRRPSPGRVGAGPLVRRRARARRGILLGSNEDIPAFRWVEKETATTMACSAPARLRGARAPPRAPASGLLADGGASRGNLLSGEAEHVILTVSRMEAEKGANPGYRAFFANGFNVTRRARALLLGGLPRVDRRAARDPPRRAVRAGTAAASTRSCARRCASSSATSSCTASSPTCCKGRPAIYATFSSYDEVAHHSGLERADTLEALRKLDQQFGRIDRARRYVAPPVRDRRPLRSRPDAGRDVQAAQRLRARRPRRALARRRATSRRTRGGDEQNAMVGARGRRGDRRGHVEEASAEERRVRPRGRRARARATSASSTSWTSGAA